MENALEKSKHETKIVVFSTTWGMGPQVTMFQLFKTVLIAVRRHRWLYYEKAIIPVNELDLNLAHTTNDEDRGDDVDNEDDEVDDEVENVEEVSEEWVE